MGRDETKRRKHSPAIRAQGEAVHPEGSFVISAVAVIPVVVVPVIAVAVVVSVAVAAALVWRGDCDWSADQPSAGWRLCGKEAGARGDSVAPSRAFTLLEGEFGTPVCQTPRGDADFQFATALGLNDHGGRTGGRDDKEDYDYNVLAHGSPSNAARTTRHCAHFLDLPPLVVPLVTRHWQL